MENEVKMIHELETLNALEKHKTMIKAATSLRVTQSTVSKRIQSLESMTDKTLIIKKGRRVELTSAGHKLLNDALPLLRELKELLGQDDVNELGRLTIGFSESILSTWGAKFIGKYAKKTSLIIEPHAHRTPVIVDKVASGDYNIAIIGGLPKEYPGLHKEEIGKEEMVIIGNNGPLFCVETSSGTWKAISKQVLRKRITIEERSEFLNPIARMAKTGFCRGLVPITVAKASGFKSDQMTMTGITRPLFAVARKRVFERAEVKDLIEQVMKFQLNR